MLRLFSQFCKVSFSDTLYLKSLLDNFNSYQENYFFDKKQTYFLLITPTGQHFDNIISQGVGVFYIYS